MRKTRVYAESDLIEGECVSLGSEASHHLLHVLKRRAGDPVHAFNGRGGYFESEISHVDKRTVTLRVGRHIDEDRESPLNLTLVQGIARGQKMDYTIQKAVELGVTTIVPLLSEFSNIRLDAGRSEKRLGHWQKIIISACEQSGRNILPSIVAPLGLADWLQSTSVHDKLVLDPAAGQALARTGTVGSEIAIICGPEGGLSGSELALCADQGCRRVSLGPRILRTETAAVAALVICQSQWGDIR